MEILCNRSIIANNKINIKELAEKLDVSPASVSLALSGKGNISDKLRQRIIEGAEKMGYTPSFQAKTLRKSNIKIAVVIPAGPEHIYNKFKAGIKEAVYEFTGGKLECTLYEYSTSDDDGYAALREIINSNYDGAVLNLDDMSEERCYFDLFNDFNGMNIPVISLGNKLKHFKTCSSVWVDAKQGGLIAADMFKLMGCKEVLVLSGSMFSSIHQRYTNGFAAAIKKYGMKISDIGYTEDNPQKTSGATAEKFPKESKNAGVFITTCYSPAVCDELKRLGVNAPVIGMDLLPDTEEYLMTGQLSATICQHQTLQAKSAVNKLLEAILSDNGNEPMDDVIIVPYIVTKGSLGKSEY